MCGCSRRAGNTGYVRPCCVSVTLVSSLLPSNSAVYCLDYTAYFVYMPAEMTRLDWSQPTDRSSTVSCILKIKPLEWYFQSDGFLHFLCMFLSVHRGKLSHVYKFQCWSLIQEIIPVRSHLISKSLQVTHAIWIIIWVWNSRFCNVKLFMRIHRVDQKKFAFCVRCASCIPALLTIGNGHLYMQNFTKMWLMVAPLVKISTNQIGFMFHNSAIL